MATDRSRFGHDTTADEVLDGLDLTGKVVLVTGATGGLGKETARALAARGAQVVLTARAAERGQAAVDDILAAHPGAKVSARTLELSRLAAVEAFAEAFLAEHPRLDVLINNAGIMACPLGATEDGFERQFGTNHLGHFLLTRRLEPALREAGAARVVSVSSRAHRRSPVVFEDIHYDRREYEKWAAYGQSKTANALFAVALDRRLRAEGIRAFSLHPGVIKTDLFRHLDAQDLAQFQSLLDEGTWSLKDVPAGAATSVYAATAPELDGEGGVYLEDCRRAAVDDDPAGLSGVRSYATDPEAAERLWAVSEQMLADRGVKFH